MYSKLILSVACFLIVALFIVGSALPASRVDALALEGIPRLDDIKIYFTEANGEASRFDRSESGVSRFAGLLWDLGATLETLDWRAGIPADADLVAIVGPTSDLSPDQIARLWSYLERDAGLLLLADPLVGIGRRVQGLPAGSGLFTLFWEDMGMRVRDDVLVTEQLGQNAVVLTDRFATSNVGQQEAVTTGIAGSLAFSGARSIEIDTTMSRFVVRPLIFSPTNFYGEVAYSEYLASGEARYNIGEDTPPGALVVGVTAANDQTNTRVAIIGDREFATNGGGLHTSPPDSDGLVYPDNARLLLQLVGWLVNADPTQTHTFNFPTAAPTSTPTLTPTPEIRTAEIAVTLSTNTVTPREGDAVIYTLTVTNNGPQTSQDLVVTHQLPPGVTFVTASGPPRRPYAPETGAWELDIVEPGEIVTLTIVVTVNQGTAGNTIASTALISAVTSVDPEPGNDSASVDFTVQRREA